MPPKLPRYQLRQIPKVVRSFSSSPPLNADYTHAVIGGGVVGLAVARKLASRSGTSTLLIERHGSAGTETSSRNSEVIHAGLFYGTSSLKTELCIRGRNLMYELCAEKRIPHRKTKKWLIAQDETDLETCQRVHEFSKTIDAPTSFLSLDAAKNQEPDVHAGTGILESPTTGIVDSHALMTYLEAEFQDLSGDCAFRSPVTRVEPIRSGEEGYRIFVRGQDGTEDSITAETLVNSAGLGACYISNMILPESRHRFPQYAKGTYFSYSASHPKPSVLLYPAPRAGHGGLGTHLTLDMTGRVRFGPDVEWVDDPHDLKPNLARLAEGITEIRKYLPGVKTDAIDVDYCGMRPKLGKSTAQAGKGFMDFVVQREEGYAGFVNLLGIESPGLTSSLAIAERVDELLYGRI